MNIGRIHHIQITVPASEEAAARDFYLGFLGLTEIEKPRSLQGRGGFWVLLAGQELHVSLEEGVNRHATKAHVAYEVDDLAAWREKLTAAGLKIADSVPIPGYHRFEFRDPFGNRVEFIQPVKD